MGQTCDVTTRVHFPSLVFGTTVLVRVLQRNRTKRMYRYKERKRFILRNWLMQSWRLTSPKTCKWSPLNPAGDPGEPMYQFQSEDRKKPMSLLEGHQVGGIPFYSG